MLLWKLLTCNNLYSQILMHLLCTYLDNCMPPNPRFPDGRPFSSQYFLRAPDKPGKNCCACSYKSLHGKTPVVLHRESRSPYRSITIISFVPSLSAAKKTDVCIYQASTNPPHYKVCASLLVAVAVRCYSDVNATQ